MSPREKLFPQQPDDGYDGRTPYERFADVASKVMQVPKPEIDRREAEWRDGKKRD